MKRLSLIVSTVTLLSLALTTCGKGIPTTQATLTEIPVTLTTPTEALATETPPPTEVTTPTADVIDLAGPPMVVGSKFMYIDGSILIAVPGGEFIMGYGGFDNPQHKVTVSDFWIYRSEVTNQQYSACVAAGTCSTPNLEDNKIYQDPRRSNDPVVGVNWEQAQTYCSWVNGHLPTEAEWEKAARGPDGNIFPWGNGGPNCDLLNYDYCVGQTTSVVEHLDGMSYYEAFDMAGNVFEWVSDWYQANYYGETPIQDPLGPEIGSRRSVRSSSYQSGADDSIAARRYSSKPIDHRADLGFRCVVQNPTYFAPFCKSPLVYGLDGDGNPVPGSDVKEDCPTVDFNPGPNCGPNYSPVTNVNPVVSPPDSSFDPPSIPASCVGGPSPYICYPPGGTVSVTVYCSVPVVGEPTCPPGTTQSGDQCKSKGISGQCPAGSTYDSSNKCCTPIGGDDLSFKFCPTGTYYANPPGICVPYPASGSKTYSYDIEFVECGKRKDQGCDPTIDPNCDKCPDGQTYQCIPNPQCVPTRICTLPDVCSCQ